MRIRNCDVLVLALVAYSGQSLSAREDSAAALLRNAQAALKQGRADEALRLAGTAVAREPNNAAARLVRGVAYAALQKHIEAIADFDAALRLDPKAADAYDHRGSEHFKLGHIREAVADFDRFLELRPRERSGHWRRGIALYYAGRFDDGRRQFEGYESVDTNDVENAVWHYLCNARAVGTEKARAAMLKIGHDRRVPLMRVYDLFRGQAKPADILKTAEADDVTAAERRQRLFYAHLYLGLYAESVDDPPAALEHLTKAAGEYELPGHYMCDVARVHRDRLRQAAAKNRGK